MDGYSNFVSHYSVKQLDTEFETNSNSVVRDSISNSDIPSWSRLKFLMDIENKIESRTTDHPIRSRFKSGLVVDILNCRLETQTPIWMVRGLQLDFNSGYS